MSYTTWDHTNAWGHTNAPGALLYEAWPTWYKYRECPTGDEHRPHLCLVPVHVWPKFATFPFPGGLSMERGIFWSGVVWNDAWIAYTGESGRMVVIREGSFEWLDDYTVKWGDITLLTHGGLWRKENGL